MLRRPQRTLQNGHFFHVIGVEMRQHGLSPETSFGRDPRAPWTGGLFRGGASARPSIALKAALIWQSRRTAFRRGWTTEAPRV
jgi:hypothetical protein